MVCLLTTERSEVVPFLRVVRAEKKGREATLPQGGEAPLPKGREATSQGAEPPPQWSRSDPYTDGGLA